MGLDERLGYIVLGALIGFVVGYMTGRLRDIETLVKEVDEIVKEDRGIDPEADQDRNERGVARFTPFLKQLPLFLALVFTLYAAFSAQAATNKEKQTSERLDATVQRLDDLTTCNTDILGKALNALNERTTYSGDQAALQLELQKAQATFLRIIIGPPPPTDEAAFAALKEYFDKLTQFAVVSEKSQEKIRNNSYPTKDQLDACFTPSTKE